MLGEPGSASAPFAELIRLGHGVHNRAGFEQMKAEALLWRPVGYDEYQRELRWYYEGHIAPIVRDFAPQRFPNTAKMMPIVAFNFAELFAVNGAAVFDYPPSWYLKRGEEKLTAEDYVEEDEPPDAKLPTKAGAIKKPKPQQSPDDTKRAKDFAEMVKEAALETLMAEAERRCVLARTLFIRVHSDSIESKATGKPPKTKPTLFWPNDVLIIPHPRCPTSLATCVGLMARISGDSGVRGAGVTWEVWTRAYVDDEDGNLASFGKWKCEIVTETTTVVNDKANTTVNVKPVVWKVGEATTDEWPLPMLPWVEWHHGVANGSPFLDANRNLVSQFNNANCSWSSELFAVDMNAAAVLYYQSDRPGPKSVTLGPGAMPKIATDESIQQLQMGADFEGMRASNDGFVATMAKTNRQSASDYDATQSGAPESAVALKIRNQAIEKARIEAVSRAIEVMGRLLAVMVMVHDHWRATSIADEGVSYCMEPQDPPEYEEREATQRRALEAESAGGISLEKAMVVSGYYRTEAEATEAIKKIREEKAARVPSALRQQLDGIAMEPGQKPDPFAKKPMVPPPPANDNQPADGGGQPDVTDDKPITVNEITLGIERMGRLGDVDTVNILRRSLAQKLCVAYEGDINAADLPVNADAGDRQVPQT